MTRDASPAGNYAHGFCGYSYAVPYTNLVTGTGYGTWAGFSPSLVAQVTPTWDDIPDMPWKTSPTNGHMMGTVTILGTGAWADGATVSITGPVSRTQTNDGTGFYAFIDLPPGSYTVIASKTGYPNATGTVAVAVGEVTGNMYERNLVLGSISPSITTQPQSQSVNQSSNAIFSVVAAGTPAPSYQWRFNSTDIAGATDSSYTRSNVQPGDAGSYSVVVSNIAGTATSCRCRAHRQCGADHHHPAAGPERESEQQRASSVWSRPAPRRRAINGASTAPTSPTRPPAPTRCSNAQPADAGSYSVVVSNIAGTVASADAVLTVTQPTPPQIDLISVLPDGQVRLQVSGAPGHYAVEATTNLLAWAELTNFITTGSNFQYLDSETNLIQRFYRMRRIP